MAKDKPFATEAELCAEFLDWVDPRVWTAYPETEGWDILLVRPADGFQIGIEAKLRLNAAVVTQAIEQYGAYQAVAPGPDCRAVLVPASSGFKTICKYLGIVIVTPSYRSSFRARKGRWEFTPRLPDQAGRFDGADWPEWCPAKRHALPAYVPDSTAGTPSPVQLTEWKIKAIKLAVIVERRGFALRADFKHLNLDHRRWIDGDWLIATPSGLIPGGTFPDLKAQHPRNYAEIAADYAAWAPKDADRLI